MAMVGSRAVRSVLASRAPSSTSTILFTRTSCQPSRREINAQLRAFSSSKPVNSAATLNLPRWLEKNSHLLQPPVNNYCVYHPDSPETSGITVMVVGGPNARNDYHINETPEFFYQHKGSMLLRTVDESVTPHKFVDIPIHENSLYLLPANTPHNPVRFADTVGVVVEQKRPADSIDHMRWYCKGCHEIVHQASFHCTDLGTQIKQAVQEFDKSVDQRTCQKCGTVNESKPAPGEIQQPPRFPE